MPNTVGQNPADPCIERSDALYQRARRLIPSATQTLAKGATQYVEGVTPKFLARGQGARVVDVDGNEYLDFVMGLGAVSLGYAYPAVDEAIRAQLEAGVSFSLVHPLEVEVAERIHELVPSAEMVRFSKTGAEVTSAAVRLARAYTGRGKVLCCGYHGWHDWYVGSTTRSAGVVDEVSRLTNTFAYNDLQDLSRKLDSETACVIMEPVAFQLPDEGFLQGVRELCTKRGALLVFDEMWTGFRASLGGAQALFGVTPDLSCFSKAIANGMPLSALVGRADVMQRIADDSFFFFTTFGGETLSLAAAKATMREMQQHDVPAQLSALGARLRHGLETLCSELGLSGLSVSGLPARTALTWTDAASADPLIVKSFVQQELIRHGVLWTGFHALCLSHSESDIDTLLDAYRVILPELAERLKAGSLRDALRGRPIQPVFKPRPQGRPGGIAALYPSVRPGAD